MLNISLKVSSWRYKHSLRRVVTVKDDKTVVNRNNAAAQKDRVLPNASFVDGVATKDCIIDPSTSVSIRIFLPHHCLGHESGGIRGFSWLPETAAATDDNSNISDYKYPSSLVEVSDGSSVSSSNGGSDYEKLEDVLKFAGGYYPRKDSSPSVKLPVILQFHDGAFIAGSKDTASNDLFCRRIAKACKSVVIAVGYRLAPDHRYPCARDDGLYTLRWLAKQANIATFATSKLSKDSHGIIECFGHMLADPWLSAHVDYSKCVLMGAGAGGSIAEQVAKSSAGLKKELDPLKVLGQILLYPLFGGIAPLPSEILLRDAYFMDKGTLGLLWSWALPEGETLDHPAVDPLNSSCGELLGKLPSTLVISGELDMLRDRAANYVEALKRVQVDATFITYRNAVHGFATMDCMIGTKSAQACVEDIAMWFGKHVKCEFWN